MALLPRFVDPRHVPFGPNAEQLRASLPMLASGASALTRGYSLPFRRVRAQPLTRRLEGPLTYAAIGASDTVGWGVQERGRDGWVPSLARELPQPARLLNLGVGGTRLRAALTEQLPRAIASQPDLVTIWLAVNDVLGGVSLRQYEDDLHHLLGELRARTSAVIAIGNVPYPPAALDPWGFPDLVKRAVAGRWNAVIGGASRRHGAIEVDLYRRWDLAAHPEFIGPDGLHPTHAGYRALAATFLDSLRAHAVL